MIVLHFLIVLYWRFKVNRKYYAAASSGDTSESAPFTPLPGVLAFPNLELTLFTAFMTGMMKNTFAVYGTYAGDYQFNAPLWTMAIITSLLLFLFFAWYSYQLVLFQRTCVESVWHPAAGKETDDVALKLISTVTVGLVKPGPRKRGAFKPPKEWTVEPARTEALSAPFLFWMPKPKSQGAEFEAGMKNEALASWLGDGTGTLKYKMVLMMLQTLLTFVMSIFSVVKKQYDAAKNTCFILVIILQVCMVAWHLVGQPNDRLKALVSAFGTTLEVIVISLTFASSLANDARQPETAQALGTAGPSIMLYVTLIPLGLEMYDSLFLPIRKIIKNGKADGASTKTIIITLLFLPLTILLKVLKIGGPAAGNINKVAGIVKKTSKKTSVATRDIEVAGKPSAESKIETTTTTTEETTTKETTTKETVVSTTKEIKIEVQNPSDVASKGAQDDDADIKA